MMKKILTQLTLLMSLSLLLVGCGGNDKNTSVPTPPPAPPSVDLLTAAVEGDLNTVNQHIAAGTDLNQKDLKPTGKGDNALGLAAVFGHASVSKALIDAGADLNGKNNDGSTPLHMAAFLCRTEIVQMLLEKGADRSIRNNTGTTALESVQAPWIAVKGIYDLLNAFLFTPMQIPLDYDRIQKTRPKIVQLIQQ
ncbi:MAG: ankyrin repeat domain-containing protein [Verrucomicrobia bacterium]|nr:ankyrin repeat domain-containing protein [Verrucomicrobiota bacterium]MBT6804724.1 ankyrin repeat domain-containing protein [Verrucomicrobiota bacterium]